MCWAGLRAQVEGDLRHLAALGSEQAQAWLAETASLPDAAFAAWQDPGITFDHERTLRARAARRRARRSDAALLAAVLALACACAYLGARAL
jgi:hypothetical protein